MGSESKARQDTGKTPITEVDPMDAEIDRGHHLEDHNIFLKGQGIELFNLEKAINLVTIIHIGGDQLKRKRRC